MKFNTFFIILFGIIIGIVLKLFVVDIVKVSGTSMEPAIADGSVTVIYKLAYGLINPVTSELAIQWDTPEKGDIVTYIYNDKTIVKRCIGIGGEALDFSADSRYSIYVSGEEYPLSEEQYQRIKYDEIVPEHTIFVIGDNASHSVDSRDYGFIPVKNILGKVVR